MTERKSLHDARSLVDELRVEVAYFDGTAGQDLADLLRRVVVTLEACGVPKDGPDNGVDGHPSTQLQPTCYGYCGDLGWTVRDHGRVTHKQSCPRRCEPWCQTHPEGCPEDCVPLVWKGWRDAHA